MADPVIAADGHSYERAEIEKWFATGKQTSPMTNSAMASQTLVSNHGLKSQIKEWQGRSNAQRVADLITAVVLTDDATEVERQLGSLAQFVGHRKAVVQPHDIGKAGKALEAELIAFCRQHLSPIKCPKSIDFEQELPRTPTGKLVKRHLRDRYWPKAPAKA